LESQKGRIFEEKNGCEFYQNEKTSYLRIKIVQKYKINPQREKTIQVLSSNN
jgi:hypothetical protein